MTMIMPLTNPEASKVGSDGDPIRRGLFACQPLSVLAQRLKLDGSPGPFQTIADASESAKAGKVEEAKSLLRSILLLPNLETRMRFFGMPRIRPSSPSVAGSSRHRLLQAHREARARMSLCQSPGYR